MASVSLNVGGVRMCACLISPPGWGLNFPAYFMYVPEKDEKRGTSCRGERGTF